jgi:hypothetical protein
VNSKEIGGGFLRFINLLSFAFFLFFGALFWMGEQSFDYRVIFFIIPLWSFLFVGLRHQDEKKMTMWVHYFVQIICLLALIFLLFSGESHSYQYLFFFSSAFLMGIITFSMVLGHWYLLTPKLSERPLLLAIYIVWGTLLFKICLSFLTFSPDFYQGNGGSFNLLILLMRVLWGYVIIGVLSYFAYRLIKMRSIQSATGILYVMTFFVFIGELISIYHYFKAGVYL